MSKRTFTSCLAATLMILTGVVSAKTVVCIGDSNTQGRYPKMLASELGTGWDVVDCGRGGSMLLSGTRYSYLDLPHYQQALDAKPDVVLIMMGTNDAMPQFWSGKKRKSKGSSAEEFKATYLGLIDTFQSMDSKPKILIVVPPPVFPELYTKNPQGAQGRKDNLEAYVIPLVREIAQERSLPTVDLHTLMKDSPELASDGIHFNKSGYRKMAEEFATAIKKL